MCALIAPFAPSILELFMGSVAKHGDPTTTGGNVLAFSNKGSNNGINIALDGDFATCGKCHGGPWPISGSCSTMTFDGRAAVQNGDLVLCPCGQNRIIAISGDMSYSADRGRPAQALMTESVAISDVEEESHECYFEILNALSDTPIDGFIYKLVSGEQVLQDSARLMNGATSPFSAENYSDLTLTLWKGMDKR